MINNIEPYITNENIYLIANFGVLFFILVRNFLKRKIDILVEEEKKKKSNNLN